MYTFFERNKVKRVNSKYITCHRRSNEGNCIFWKVMEILYFFDGNKKILNRIQIALKVFPYKKFSRYILKKLYRIMYLHLFMVSLTLNLNFPTGGLAYGIPLNAKYFPSLFSQTTPRSFPCSICANGILKTLQRKKYYVNNN